MSIHNIGFYGDMTKINFEPFLITVKFLNFGTPKNFAVIYLKFKQRGQTFGCFVKEMQIE